MDSRGFGRRGPVSRAQRRATTAAVVIGLLAVAVAIYGLLDSGSPAVIGMPLLVIGTVVAAAAVGYGGRVVLRTRYRRDPWSAAEWLTVISGATAVAGVLLAGRLAPGSLHPGTYPIVPPTVSWPAIVGILLALLPAFLSPGARVGSSARPQRRHHEAGVTREAGVTG
jgi:energy-coupling factor transport system permease protein